ncbi:transglycosylase SLT domain-containing protein [Streptomyces palmae]|uniref:Lytic transglycosylase n=1 Tax=Streptomyces palmae TaxID=1701085 RepID=A0A4Z0HAJ8_9ACTN|nr:transglycosylase SLT domain-containing protein [Streptomyces palmae]TGB11564.1 lytic transglycosylase [Streptomyces palmae]
MRIRSISGTSRLTKTHKLSAAGIAAAGTAALAISLVPGTASAAPQDGTLNAKPVAAVSSTATGGKIEQASLTQQSPVTATKKADAKPAAGAKQDVTRTAGTTANLSERTKLVVKPVAATTPAKKSYSNNLDGWIRESLDIMKAKGIPGSYEGLHRNIMRESTGNPQAINNWDVNATNGVPSKGLLQVIDPTFKAYHVDGTSWNIYDPVANITAACNYAADRYGSMDNVNSAY